MTATQLKYPPGKYTIHPVPRWFWWLLTLPLLLFLLFVAVAGYPFNVSVEDMLGFRLPNGVANIQMEVQPHFFGEYDAYLRFELPPESVDGFLSEAHFQMQRQTSDPMTIFANAVFGQTPAADAVATGQPDWWLPASTASGGEFTLAYRSSISPENNINGADAAWYIVDQRDATRAVMYVFVREV